MRPLLSQSKSYSPSLSPTRPPVTHSFSRLPRCLLVGRGFSRPCLSVLFFPFLDRDMHARCGPIFFLPDTKYALLPAVCLRCPALLFPFCLLICYGVSICCALFQSFVPFARWAVLIVPPPFSCPAVPFRVCIPAVSSLNCNGIILHDTLTPHPHRLGLHLAPFIFSPLESWSDRCLTSSTLYDFPRSSSSSV